MLANRWRPNPDEVELKIEDSKLSIGEAAALRPIQYSIGTLRYWQISGIRVSQ